MKKIIICTIITIILISGIYLSYNKAKTIEYNEEETINYENTTDILITDVNNKINITNGGSYHLTGTSKNSSIIVNTEEKVNIILDNVDLTNPNGPVLLVENSDKTIISLVGENKLTDESTYEFAEYDAVIYSKDDLDIVGEGSLSITANFENCIKSNDDLKINSNITIKANTNGIIGKDSVTIKGGNINITSNEDSIKSNNDTDEGKGNVIIEGGSITINSKEDGIQAFNDLTITGGTFNIVTDSKTSNSSSAILESSKALKSGNDIIIDGGVFTINSSDDSIHSNNDVIINDGTFTINSLDDGIHADNAVTINNGIIKIEKSYEGLEGTTITINDGDISVVASDDGVNAAGGNDKSAMNRPGMNNFSGSTGTLIINGGVIYIDSKGDGLDANGNISMTGGTVTVEGPTDNGNGAIDYDGTFEITGGIIVASGSSGMAQGPNNGSQYSVLINLTSSYTNKNIVIKDSDGTEVLNITPSKTFSSIAFSNSNLKTGNYIIFIDGKEYETFTISSERTTVGKSSMGAMPNNNINGGRR